MLQKDKKHSDSIALTESLLIAVWRLLGDGLALSVCFAATSPKGRGLSEAPPQSSTRAAASSFVSRLRTAKYAGMRKKQAKNHATGLAMQAAK